MLRRVRPEPPHPPGEEELTRDEVLAELQIRALYLARIVGHYCDPTDPLYQRAQENYVFVRGAVAMVDRFAAWSDTFFEAAA
jgi:hypothetical protein